MRRQRKKEIRSGETLAKPRLPEPTALRQVADLRLEDEDRHSDVRAFGGDFVETTARHMIITQSVLERAVAALADFRHMQLLDSRCAGCDFSNSNWEGAALTRVEFGDCRLTGWRIHEGILEDVLFHDCTIRLAQFYGCTFRGVRFERCDLQEAGFQEADVRGAVFVDCNLAKADVSDAELNEADLRGCNIDNLRVSGPRDVRGVVVDPQQAAYLAGLESLLALSVRG